MRPMLFKNLENFSILMSSGVQSNLLVYDYDCDYVYAHEKSAILQFISIAKIYQFKVIKLSLNNESAHAEVHDPILTPSDLSCSRVSHNE